MFQILFIFGPAVITYVIAGYLTKRSASRWFSALIEIFFYAVVNTVITTAVLMPFDKVKIIEMANGLNNIQYGKTAYFASILVSVFTGLLVSVVKAINIRIEAERSAKDRDQKKNNRKAGLKGFLLRLLVFLLLLLSFSLLWCIRNYGNISLEEVVFHLNMPLEGTSDEFIFSYIKTALCPALLLFFGYLFLVYYHFPYRVRIVFTGKKRSGVLQLLPMRLPRLLSALILLAWLGMILLAADRSLDLFGYIHNQISASSFIEEEYVSPDDVTITFPEKKRNLIYIYVESGESSAQDKENGGVFDVNLIPEMTELAKNNVSFSQSDLIEGACVAPACGWTIAALVAQTSGLPLKLYSYNDRRGGADNSMKNYTTFMPGAVTLGDILEKEGYHNVFLAGSNFKFGGRTNYFTQHGNYEIWDYIAAKKEGAIPEDYKVWWGFEDAKLYEFTKEKLLALAEEEEPFNLSLLTVDTHHQNGYVCDLCPHIYDDQYSDVWACASRQLDNFVRWIQEQDFYENTTIVICGDHCSMDTDFYADITYEKHHGETTRKVYNAIINPAVQPVKEKNRKFTTLDMFPTTLASLGAQIKGDRLGLGTNLFSERETLAEEYGYETMFAELDKKSVFYNNEILYP